MIRYVSTRGQSEDRSFTEVLLDGLAPDGGLYCPVEIPPLAEIDPNATYADVATAVMWPYVDGTIPADDFAAMVAESYAGFRHPDVAPVIELGGDQWLCELFWGPTLAFKDVALQLVGRLLDYELTRQNRRITVIGATSGDTGSAAIEALANRSNVNVVILHPHGRVSDVQRRQMTTVDAPNVVNLAVDGSFDDCQDLVKAAFAEPSLRDELGLAAVNSINWARVMAQIVYYVTSARTVAPDGASVSFCVPTGNFGNVLAGWYAKQMGLPVDRLVVASNRNDILTRYFETGRLTAHDVEPSLSPSMDIQVSSNFERLLWEASGRDGAAVTDLLTTFRSDGDVEVPEPWRAFIAADLDFGRTPDDETLQVISQTQQSTELVVDPHTAVGLSVAHQQAARPMITLATAHPAKFPDAVAQATGQRPELPAFLSELSSRHERYTRADASLEAVIEAARTLGV